PHGVAVAVEHPDPAPGLPSRRGGRPPAPLLPARLAAVLRLDGRLLPVPGLDLLPAPERAVPAAALRAELRRLVQACPRLPAFRRDPFTATRQGSLSSRPAPDSETQSRARATRTDCGPAPATPATSTAVPAAASVPAQDPSGRRARDTCAPGEGS